MIKDHRDAKTSDMFLDPITPSVIAYDDVRALRSSSISGEIAKAISHTMKTSPIESRQELASKMSDYLGEEISVNALNNWASESKTDKNINVPKLMALMAVTEDYRPLSIIAKKFGLALIPESNVALLEEAIIDQEIAKLEAKKDRIRRGR